MNLQIIEHWIETSLGKIFACSWRPKSSEGKIPIILFHDSLGCVELWRDFPEKLALATERQVIWWCDGGVVRESISASENPQLILDAIAEFVRDLK